MSFEIPAAPELREIVASGLFLQGNRCLLRLLQLQSCENGEKQVSFAVAAAPEAEKDSLATEAPALRATQKP